MGFRTYLNAQSVKAEIKESRYPIKGYLFLVSTAFFTALSYVFGKAVNKELNPETVTFFWFFSAFFFSLFVVILLPSQRMEIKNIGRYLPIFFWSSVVTAIGAALWILSLRTIGPPLTSFLMKSQTLFSLLLGILFLGERLNRWEMFGIIVTITGGVVVAYQKEGYLILGTFMALLSAFCYSLLSFLVKKIAQNLNMLTVANLRALGVSIVVFAYLIATGRFQVPELRDLLFMAFGGLTGAYIAKASQFQSIKLLDVSRSTAVMPMESLFVVVFSYVFFHDLPSVTKLLGGAGIVVGVVFLVVFRGTKVETL
ncbi:MAG: hypothetical protein KatS3mg078_2358 [Deltaproteobacteria bacterium]|jgi:drug/metabolite transporter (DMT)-like permease|nr:MAG: hypothetical protein KatS3mg078_2358 [Deltaproteobacteria bacterium]